MSKCSKLEPDSNIVRCDLERGHRGLHYAELSGNVYEWGPGLSDAKPGRRKNGFSSTDDYMASEIFTDGVKAAFITEQLLASGRVTCVRCNRVILVMRDDLEPGSPEFEDEMARCLGQAMNASEKHHSDRRRGHGYLPRRFGNDFGHDLPLLIEAPICGPCHRGPKSEIHPGPQFARTAS
jgi:hypothetical protein